VRRSAIYQKGKRNIPLHWWGEGGTETKGELSKNKKKEKGKHAKKRGVVKEEEQRSFRGGYRGGKVGKGS